MSQENPYAPPEADIEVVSPNEVQLASRWARLGGSLVDGLVGFAVVFTLMFVTGMWEIFMAGGQSYADTATLSVGGLVVFLLIHGYPLATRGQTLGKMAAGTRIVSVADGRILPLWKVFGLRYIPIALIGGVPVVGQILNLVNILLIFRSDRRCGHDMIAGTRVVVA